MAEVKVLIQGYARTKNNKEHASCSTILIKDKGINVIVDPGMNRKRLLESLKKEKMSTKNIDFVLLTHYHLDHSVLMGAFEKAVVVDNTSLYSQKGTIEDHKGKVPGTNIEIVKTPGHDPFHCSVIAKTKDGTIVVSGDIFWWSDDEKQDTDVDSLLSHEDPYEKNHEELIKSRKKIIALADWIIPGHGKMFKVKK